jgi:ribosomal protein S18 acetylase RimI-like enzyme
MGDAEIPRFPMLSPTPVELRPMTPADNPAAFALADLAFTADGATTDAEQRERQARWERAGRRWYAWLHAQAGGNAWVATAGAEGPVIGYARALRDAAQRREQLTELFVHPAFQRGHIGRTLLGAVLAERVPAGWRRGIVAHPTPAALALYYRWGTLPLGTAWYLVVSRVGEASSMLEGRTRHEGHEGDEEREEPEAINRLADFMTAHLDAIRHTQVCAGHGVGWGVRCGDALGPVVGATPAGALAVIQSLLADAWAAGARECGLWVPHANVAALRWLRAAEGLRVTLAGQVTLLGSDPDLAAAFDRALLPALPYLW